MQWLDVKTSFRGSYHMSGGGGSVGRRMSMKFLMFIASYGIYANGHSAGIYAPHIILWHVTDHEPQNDIIV